ncbi:MAG: hypothetical protein IJT94_04380 [Oscillibacter sp.]|nr:hypothetical protein [Oscillibacter sp.]
MDFTSVLHEILVPAGLSLAVSFLFWYLTFLRSGTQVVFSSVIEKTRDVYEWDLGASGEQPYRCRVRYANIGSRDLMEADFHVRITLDRGRGIRNVATCTLGYGFSPVIRCRTHSVLHPYINTLNVDQHTRGEFLKKHLYGEAIAGKAEAGTLTIDDLLREFGCEMTIQIFLYGNDAVTGARRMFVSPLYREDCAVCGRFAKVRRFPWRDRLFRGRDGRRAQAEVLLSAMEEKNHA